MELNTHLSMLNKVKSSFKIIQLLNKMQLTSYENLTKENILFHKPKEYKVKDTKFKYQRIKVETKFQNGKKRSSPNRNTISFFSFRVNEKKSQETNKLVGYSIAICLWGKDEEQISKKKHFLRQ